MRKRLNVSFLDALGKLIVLFYQSEWIPLKFKDFNLDPLFIHATGINKVKTVLSITDLAGPLVPGELKVDRLVLGRRPHKQYLLCNAKFIGWRLRHIQNGEYQRDQVFFFWRLHNSLDSCMAPYVKMMYQILPGWRLDKSSCCYVSSPSKEDFLFYIDQDSLCTQTTWDQP